MKKIEFDHLGKHYAMTLEEVEAAYRYQLKQYRLEDAKRQLEMMAAAVSFKALGDDEVSQVKEYFADVYGMSFDEAAEPSMLEAYVERFEDKFDCNEPENTTWHNAITSVLTSFQEV